MNKVELVSEVSSKIGMSKKDTGIVVDAALQTIMDGVAGGDKIKLAGFGIFEKAHRNERMGHDPMNDVPIKIEASDFPKFRPSKSFKESVK